MVSPGHKREAVREVAESGTCSLRAACRYLRLHWSSFCYRAKTATDKMVRLVRAIIAVSRTNPRYGYRRVRALLANEGWQVSRKLVQKVRRAEGLGVKPPRPRQRRQGKSTGKIPTAATHPRHVWSWDFVADRTDNGAPLRVLSLIDEFTRQCISLTVARGLKSADIVAALDKAIAKHGAPEHIRSDNGPEFIATATKDYLESKRIKTLYIEPGSPWQNPHVESFHNRLQDECLKQEWFLSLTEARVVIENWRRKYNSQHPHSRLGFISPDAFAKLWHQTKAVLGSVRPTGSLHQALPQTITQPT
ncbi:IS3 family transposase [Ruficoccus amylovorans]|uniref:IS3 family transposase n=1 Tax=Ruficoccus amylovorans TaxID=1804625 RepID=A0A842HBI6_9BACT|nr:IS3 family transposase [Ruficoccus amylovorans]MBC2592638.1 IS3 family transposase [Ruficoccus amylovorans]MBC2592747.1 IS3 family transposase [Ruficoccus amylovorans]MBC2592755.1 IS3 family transposase [Ruficoccus amylovorans]MBC2592769.1 IS3 family transposase [Ruficoccus amylovorans]MBC2592770.1 IS3 family transposase [Ruficoccus amylovorans]